MESKTCNRCGNLKPSDQFSMARSRPDGRYSICLECRRAGITQTEEPPTERKCRKCGIMKPIRKFTKQKSRRDGRATICTTCQGAKYSTSHEYYEHIKNKTKERNRIVRREMKGILLAHLGNTCAHCGLQPGDEWPVDCFDFHHEDPTKKELSFARSLGIKSQLDMLILEAEGCIILCANCHRRHHAQD